MSTTKWTDYACVLVRSLKCATDKRQSMLPIRISWTMIASTRGAIDRKLYAHYTAGVTLRRRVKRIGGSLGVLLPRDFAEAMNVKEGSEVRLTLVGNQVVVEPLEGSLDDGAFRRAFAAVLRRHRRGFALLAEYDRGGWRPSGR